MQMLKDPAVEKVLKDSVVGERTGLSKPTRWRLEKKGQFPKRVYLSANRVGWLESEIQEWIKKRPRVMKEKRDEK